MYFMWNVYHSQPRKNVFYVLKSVLSRLDLPGKEVISNLSLKHFSHDSRFSLRVLFFGTDNFAVENLKILNDELKYGNLFKSLDVVTSSKVRNCVVSKYSQLSGLKTLDWPLQSCPEGYDIGLVASFGHLIPEKIINSFPLGMLNVHASLLPRWRGAAPIVHAIMSGDRKTGVSIMRIMPKRFDIGDILAQYHIDIGPHDTNCDVSNKLAVAGGRLLVTCLKDLENYSANAQPQGDVGITYAPKIQPSLGHVSWQDKNAESLYNLWRALFGIFHITTFWHGTQVRLMEAQKFEREEMSIADKPGKIIFSKTSRMILVVCAGGGKVGFRKIGVAGKKPMSAEDFYNGYMSKRSPEDWYFH
ncbi:methionyl-tRNA formyltransferase, mitochondrial isoform X1 [Ischnura elegans]|uniref:methionyl-tRNA formyltransferase, mitochondrial isoform X1 n=1 Tax=Ischnura elegans TaxID=197161 RepID=UPI001ED86876|nr:methionyl-tRNA formyltransferase, mitochondrial isoform X1 [Ischnura elegans]